MQLAPYILEGKLFLTQNNPGFFELSENHIKVIKKIEGEKTLVKKDKNTLKEMVESGVFKKTGKIISSEKIRKVNYFRLVLTEGCNLKCKGCFAIEEGQKAVSMQDVKQIISATYAYGRNPSYQFFGGEPLLQQSLIKKIISFNSDSIEKGLIDSVSYRMTTNLTILNNELINLFKKNNVRVGVSLNGTEEVNDEIRIAKDGGGTYLKVKKNLLKLLKASVEAYVLMTPLPNTIENFSEVFHELIQDIPELKEVLINTPYVNGLKWLGGKKFATELLKIHQLAEKHNVKVITELGSFFDTILYEDTKNSPCIFNNGVIAAINPQGQISNCSQEWSTQAELKDVGETLTIKSFKNDKCVECPFLKVCGGFCPKVGEDLNKCEFYYEAFKIYSQNFDLFYKEE